ncbi:MAG: dihydrofolate reductase [Desulfuromonadales bacterium]
MSVTSHPKRMPNLAILVAMTGDRTIGQAGRLPWNLPEDLRLFRRLTIGNTVVMGRRTYQAIGQPLAGRHNIVLSQTITTLPGSCVCPSFDAAIRSAEKFGRPVFVIGGRQVYQDAMPLACWMHVSWVAGHYPGDVVFPELDWAPWQICTEERLAGFRYVRYRHRDCC